MNYELAKKLKDAGFPQENRDGTFLDKTGAYAWGSTPKTVYAPTLSELIEACGEEFEMLAKSSIGWECIEYDENRWSGGFNQLSSGSTPEEAVANLWLALNQKDV